MHFILQMKLRPSSAGYRANTSRLHKELTAQKGKEGEEKQAQRGESYTSVTQQAGGRAEFPPCQVAVTGV